QVGRGRELPPGRPARTPDRGGLGPRGGRRQLRGATPGPTRPGRAARPDAQRAAGLHLSGAQGLSVRNIPGPTGVRGAVGGGTREPRETGNGKRETGARELARGRVPSADSSAGTVRLLPA